MEENNQQSDGINFSDIYHVIKKNLFLLLAIVVATFTIGIIYTFVLVTPRYQSTASVFVLSASYYSHYYDSEASDASESIRFTLSVATIIEGDSLLKPVYEDFITEYPSLNWSYETFASKISTSVPSDTFIINITCTDSNATRCKVIAQMVAEQVVKEGTSSTGLLSFLNDGFVQISDSAKSGTRTSPNVTMYLIVSVLIGLVGACVIIFIKEFASYKFKTKEEIEKLGLPIIGTIHYDKGMKQQDNPTKWLLDIHDQEFDYYDRLFTSIRYTSVDNPYKVIMITSTVSKELKTCVTANLASCMAAEDKKVCLIDLDTRNPKLHEIYGQSFEGGLADYFDNVISKSKLMKHTFENVDVITVGEELPNPTLFLSSDKLKNLINELRASYDYIIIDTPPVLEFNDAIITSSMVDGVIYNIAIDYTHKKDVIEGIKMLNQVNAPIIGINITKANYQNKKSYFMKDDNKNNSAKNKIIREASMLKQDIAEPTSEKTPEEVFNQGSSAEEVIYVDENGNEIIADDSEYDEVEYIEESEEESEE